MGTSVFTRLRTLWSLSAGQPRSAFFVNGPAGTVRDQFVFGVAGVPAEGFLSGIAAPGALCIDAITGDHYTNAGTKQVPLWLRRAHLDVLTFTTLGAAPGTPAAGGEHVYVKDSDGLLYRTDSSGVEMAVGGGLQVRDVQVTDAQLKTLPTMPVELVPAPGVNRQLLVAQAVLLIASPTAAAYTHLAATAWLGLADAGGTFLSTLLVDDVGESLSQLTSFLGAAVSPQTVLLTPAADASVTWGVLPQIRIGGANGAVQLTLHNGSNGNLTGGAPDNTLSVRTWFFNVPALSFSA